MGFRLCFGTADSFLGTEEQALDMATRGPDPTDKTQQIVRTLQDYERPFAGTGELADELGYSSNPGVQKHLQRAVNEGVIEKTSISGYNIWYLPDLVQESKIDTTGPAPGQVGSDDGFSAAFGVNRQMFPSPFGLELGYKGAIVAVVLAAVLIPFGFMLTPTRFVVALALGAGGAIVAIVLASALIAVYQKFTSSA